MGYCISHNGLHNRLLYCRPTGYCISPHLALRVIWVWGPALKPHRSWASLCYNIWFENEVDSCFLCLDDQQAAPAKQHPCGSVHRDHPCGSVHRDPAQKIILSLQDVFLAQGMVLFKWRKSREDIRCTAHVHCALHMCIVQLFLRSTWINRFKQHEGM